MNNIAVAILSALTGFLAWLGQRHFERVAAERLRKEKLDGTLLSAAVEFVGTGNEYLKAFVAVGASEGREADTAETWKALKGAEGSRPERIREYLGRRGGQTAQKDETP